MALFNNTFKAAVLFAAISFALYQGRPVYDQAAGEAYARKLEASGGRKFGD